MQIEFDPAKRETTLTERGLDFSDTPLVFSQSTITFPDDRKDYQETRFTTIGWLRGRMVVLIWTPRGERRRVISMRHANEREIAKYQTRLG